VKYMDRLLVLTDNPVISISDLFLYRLCEYVGMIEFTDKCTLEPTLDYTVDYEYVGMIEFTDKCTLEPTLDYTVDCEYVGMIEFTDKCALEPTLDDTVDCEYVGMIEITDKCALEPTLDDTVDCEYVGMIEITDKCVLEPTLDDTVDCESVAMNEVSPAYALEVKSVSSDLLSQTEPISENKSPPPPPPPPPAKPTLPIDFNWKTYLDINPDVARAFHTKEAATAHYLHSGIRETRRYKFVNVPSNFDWEVYLDLNPDIKSLITDRAGAFYHYERNGYKEHRTFAYSHVPTDFDWDFYLALNPDIKQLYRTRIEAMKHYQHYGYKEKRRYNLLHLPADFDCDTYVALNQDIPFRFLHTENSIKLHYEMYGRFACRKYKINRTNIPGDFEWTIYRERNPDILINTELDALIHYNSIGFYKKLLYKFDTDLIQPNHSTISSEYSTYSFLFHKYLLNITTPDNQIEYHIEQTTCNVVQNTFVTHLHCYDIDKFDLFYANYMDELFSASDVVITYSVGTLLPKYDQLTILKIENRGMDIGAKYCVVKYLKDIEHLYTHILFLHSKTDEHTRKLYWTPLLTNLSFIKESAAEHPENGIYVPPLIYMGDYNHCLYTHHMADPQKIHPQWNPGNVWYMNDIDGYMGFNKHNKFFPEGNCFVANKHIAESLYSNIQLYNILNTHDTFDAIWVKVWYGDIQGKNVGTNIYELYDFYLSNREILHLHPNNIKLGHLGYRDNMIEHCYERSVFKMVEKMGYDVYILPPIGVKTCSDAHIKFNKLLNRYFKTGQLE
jgi:hypothetical protein